ncbi:MAG: glucose-6-phosphate isomerase [Hydrogenibacillus sp.]|nr:glucose-6-phosphate isomerase [Hydrogenibacillus sp.]
MRLVQYDDQPLGAFIDPEEYARLAGVIAHHHAELVEKRRDGAMLGWFDYPQRIREETLSAVHSVALRIREEADVFVVIGIGGSYLGAHAAIRMLSEGETGPEVVFIGHHLSSWALERLRARLHGKNVFVNVVSKSGTTTEPAVAFRLLKADLEARYGKEGARRRIIATTDPSSGALRAMAERYGYTSFDIPRDVGGRFSVLTPVGLLPMAVAGIDIEAVLSGARAMMTALASPDVETNAAYRYAAARYILYQKGYDVELFAGFSPRFEAFGGWLAQLFAESEGKKGRGIFPVAGQYTTDLHSIGQYVQEGRRRLFETFLWTDEEGAEVVVPPADDDLDGLGYLVGRDVQWINAQAMWGTLIAHRDGGVPVSRIVVSRLTAETFGALVMFFERAVAMSGSLLGINPFDQPGVEAYKANMFALLGKPGHAERGAEIRRKIEALQTRDESDA